MDDMKISFKVEITGCLVENVRCPYLERNRSSTHCGKTEDINAMSQNIYKLTKTCPMIKKKLEEEADRMDAYLFKLEAETTDPN